MATQNFINECKNMANANRLGRFDLQMYDRFEKELKGNTLQDGTPTPDTPVEIQSVTGLQNINVCGKNLFDKSNPTIKDSTVTWTPTETGGTFSNTGTWRNGVTWRYKLDTTKTYTFRANGFINNMYCYITTYTDDTYSTTKSRIVGDGTGNITKTFTPDSEYLQIRFLNSSATSNVNISNIQLELGSTATEYEEYKGNTYEINLGKNLFDKTEIIDNEAYLNKINVSNLTINNTGISWTATSNDSYIGLPATITGGYGMYIEVKENTTYTLSFNTNYELTNYVFYIKDDYSFIQRNVSLGHNSNVSFTTPSNCEYIFIRFGAQNQTGNTINITNIQIEKGSQVTSYSPYFTPIELNKIGNYQDYIRKSTGKNLFDKDNVENNYRLDSNGDAISSNGFSLSDYIEVKPNTTYTISRANISNYFNNISEYSNDKTHLLRSYTTATTFTITTQSTTKYIRISDATSNLNIMQLEQGNVSTDLEPYGVGKWYKYKAIEKAVLNGSGTWSLVDSSRRFATTQNSIPNIANALINTSGSSSNLTPALSNYFTVSIQNNITKTSNNFGFSKWGNSVWLYFSAFKDTVADFQTWLSNNKPEIYFVLSTPEVEVITNEELINKLESIRLLKGLNNISITSEDLPVIFDYSFWNGDTEVDEDDRFLEVNQSNCLTSIELKDSCCVNNNILGTTYTKSAEVELLDLPVGTKLESQIITPEIGVKYNDDTTEYVTFDDYIIESLNDEQTGSNTKFTAMNGGALLDKEYECSLSFENGQTHTINEFYQDACSQIGITPIDSTFDNSEIVMTGNPFTNKETIRTVISEVEKTSCSIARFDWKNKTISLTWLSDQIDYEFNTSDYSTLEGSLTQYGPLNTIIIANAQLDGENVVMTDEESVAEYGEHQIIIDSPYFLYTEDLRTQAIQAIYDKLDGLTYYDLKLTTPYGKPFLNIGNKIRINTNEGQTYDTYVLTHTLTYDGAIQSVIESPALTQEEQIIKNEFKGNSVREKLRRTELMVDKTTGEITAITERVTTTEDEIGNMYSKEEVNTLVQTAQTGITNKFINSGGNNIFRNTGLWFEDTSNIEYLYPSNALYPSDDLYMRAESYFEYWQGKVVRMSEDKAANLNALLLQNTTLSQKQQVRNGKYTISFKYKKLIQLSEASVTINGETYSLDENEGEFVKTIDVTSQYISISFLCDTDNGIEIYDLMGNVGEEKAEYSQHQNETTTDTVNISKGITITSSDTNTTFKANSDGIRVYNSKNLETPTTEFTDTGTDTKKIIVKNEATIVEVLFKKVGNNTWLTKL